MVTDPNFWKRFSVAVHEDEAAKKEMADRPDLKHSASWLESQKKKSRQRTWICWCFWLAMASLVAGVVVAVLVLKAHHVI